MSYHIAKALESDLVCTVVSHYEATPDGLLQKPELVTSLAWDNYDENSETLSSTGIPLHETVGICNHNIAVPDQILPTEVPTRENTKARKRSLKFTDTSLDPYRKKPKFSEF